MHHRLCGFLLALAIISGPAAVAAEPLTVVGFNVESGGANLNVLASQIEELADVDLWGFSEVQDSAWERRFREAAAVGENASFNSILGTTGGADRLQIAYDSDRLELVRQFELHAINVGGNVRAPLVGEFRDKASGQSFLFMVNHLYRSQAERRYEQARMLNGWARIQTLPVIAVGDYNFDWNAAGGETDHDRGFDEMTADNVFAWVKPAAIIKTNCSPHNSVLDFVFVSGAAQQWSSSSSILFSEPSYCSNEASRSDHRPVLAAFELGAPRPAATKEQLLERLESIQRELDSLKRLIESL
jgi:endonuclease/exonuclease/phosphatase family metal-dependent hydrolase